MRKSVSSFRAVNQTHAEWQTFENPENKRNVWQSGMVDLFLWDSKVINLQFKYPNQISA